ncbi:hypothetical protein CROQUDRAFT_218570 [Cronartium quercuum f. sp. fusiforme G11]|uniref:Uncharacterized protein n=1 Tax=Cronartium quercuum f. sp. fusiforme G11 TaxID=708437 RepID=A0A9P6T8M3_9BASI|nr:hypothetical protein CROQUDRAFT_218570 [Cronartium quercuum f. sp. fusiforme G11]
MSRLSLNTAPDLTCVTSLSDSSSLNVYHAVHSFLRSKNDPPTNPSWARVTLITMLLAHVIMLLIAACVLSLRMLSKKFTLASITRHGVLRPNATGCVTICCILYDIFAVAGLGMQLAIDYGISNPAAKVHIPGIKYVIIWIGVWCFCWSTACQYICARWDPPWQSGSMDRKLNIVPLPVVMMLNIMSVGIAIVGVAIIMTVFSLANYQYTQLSDAVDYIEATLAKMSLKHEEQTYEVLSNLPNMPLNKLDHLIHRFSFWLKIRIFVCLALNSTLLVVYSPFIIFTYVQLKQYRKFTPKDWVESKKGPQKSKRKKSTRIDCRKEMRTLLATAGTIYSVLIVEWPLLVWEYLHISAGHCHSAEGLVIREMASDVIVSIIGNLVIGATLAQTIRIIQPKPWAIRRSIQRPFSRQPQPPQTVEPNAAPKPPVRELTVSVLQVTESQASEPLDQPNFDILHSWAQRKAQANLQVHVEKDDKGMEMDLLDTQAYQRHDLSS